MTAANRKLLVPVPSDHSWSYVTLMKTLETQAPTKKKGWMQQVFQITDLSSKINLFNITCYCVRGILYMLKDINKSIEYDSGGYGSFIFHTLRNFLVIYRGADQSLARRGRKQATATEYFNFHISHL